MIYVGQEKEVYFYSKVSEKGMEEFIVEEEITKEQPETSEELEVKEPNKPDKIEALAEKLGWKLDGELSANDFILKSRDIQDSMRGHINEQKKQISDLGSSVEALRVHNEKVYKAEVTQLKEELNTLKVEKKEAIEEGDVEKVDELDGKIDNVKDAMTKPDVKQESINNPEFDTWVGDNAWYKTDSEMAKYADTIADQNPGASFERILSLVTKKTKEMFPDKFEVQTTSQKVVSPVEGAGRKITNQNFTKSDLTDNQRATMSQFVRQGIMTEKQYITDIQKLQE